MRVLHIVDALMGGGIQQHVGRVTRCLSAAGVATAVAAILPPTSDDLPQATLGPDTPYLLSPVRRAPSRGPRIRGLHALDTRWRRESIAWLAEVARDFDIIHSHAYYSSAFVGPAAVRSGRHSVATLHDSSLLGSERSGQERGLLRLAKRLYARRMFAPPTHLVSVAAWLAADTEARVPRLRGRVTAIPNGVDPYPALGEAAPDPGRVVCVSMFRGDKNHRRLLEAWSQVCADDTPATLALYGLDTDPARQCERGLRALAEERCRPGSVEFGGWLACPEPVVARAWCYVSASLREASPLSVANAIAVGAPCILSDIPAHREIAGTGGCALYVAPTDVDGLAEALRLVVHDSDARHAMALAARQRARELPTWEQCTGRLIELYRTVLGAD